MSSIDGNLIVGGISVLDTQVEVLNVKIKIWQDMLSFDVIPDNSSHFISIEITYWFGDLDLGGESS